MNKYLNSLLVMLCISSFCHAQEIEEVTTIATRVPQLSSSVPASISVVDATMLESVQHEHIQQAINQLAGVSLQHGSGQEYLPAIRSPVLTGAGACGAFLITENNLPLRAAGFCNINELFEAHTEQAERVEVLRGPGTALHGSNAMHGVINVQTIPVDAESQVSIDAGAYDYARIKLGLNNDQTGLKLTVTHDDGWRADSGYDQQKLSLFQKVQRGGLSITGGLSVTHLEQETAGFLVGENAYQDAGLAKQNFDPEAYRNVDSLRVWAALELDNAWNARITPYLRYTDMEFLQHFLPGKPLEENGQKSAGVMLQFEPREGFTVGLDAEFTNGFLRQAQNAPTVGSPFLQATIPAGLHYDYQVDATLLSPFFQYLHQFNSQWSLTAGARFESMSYDYDNLMLAGRTTEDGTSCGFGGCRYSRPADRKDSYSNFSPKLGILFNANQQQQYYANVSHGFRAPQATELYRLQRAQTVADLDSEEILNMEIGTRGSFERWNYSLALYGMQKKNVIFRDSNFFNISNGETTHRGLELEASVTLTNEVEVSAAFSYAKHKYANSVLISGVDIQGNLVDTAPELTGSLRLSWQPLSQLNMTLEGVVIGDYYLEPENLNSYQGHELLHLRNRWQINEQWSAYLNIENLTDQRYADRADFTGFTGERYFPGKPRNLQLGIQRRW